MRGGAILLAAGFGRRFGSDKRHHTLPDGTPLLLASLRRYRSTFAGLVVVLRPDDTELARMVAAEPGERPVQLVLCEEAHLGMGHSLACGARAAPPWPYLFVALADMAWVRADTLERLVEVIGRAPPDGVVQPVYRGTPGHPVGFGRAHRARLGALTGDTGARELLRAAGDALLRLEVDDPGVLMDLDVPSADVTPP